MRRLRFSRRQLSVAELLQNVLRRSRLKSENKAEISRRSSLGEFFVRDFLASVFIILNTFVLGVSRIVHLEFKLAYVQWSDSYLDVTPQRG